MKYEIKEKSVVKRGSLDTDYYIRRIYFGFIPVYVWSFEEMEETVGFLSIFVVLGTIFSPVISIIGMLSGAPILGALEFMFLINGSLFLFAYFTGFKKFHSQNWAKDYIKDRIKKIYLKKNKTNEKVIAPKLKGGSKIVSTIEFNCDGKNEEIVLEKQLRT